MTDRSAAPKHTVEGRAPSPTAPRRGRDRCVGRLADGALRPPADETLAQPEPALPTDPRLLPTEERDARLPLSACGVHLHRIVGRAARAELHGRVTTGREVARELLPVVPEHPEVQIVEPWHPEREHRVASAHLGAQRQPHALLGNEGNGHRGADGPETSPRHALTELVQAHVLIALTVAVAHDPGLPADDVRGGHEGATLPEKSDEEIAARSIVGVQRVVEATWRIGGRADLDRRMRIRFDVFGEHVTAGREERRIEIADPARGHGDDRGAASGRNDHLLGVLLPRRQKAPSARSVCDQSPLP